ncbi:MAG: hypothetical protein AABY87_05115 [bacterium]
MKETAAERMIPSGTTWQGLLSLALLAGLGYAVFGKGVALGMAVGMAVGLVNFKAIAFIVSRLFRPDPFHKVFYGLFGVLKILILVAVFLSLIYYNIFNVYGLVAGFSAALISILVEGMIRAGRCDRDSAMSKVL